MKLGTMKTDVHQLGTSLKLNAGQRVALTWANNLPQGGWFARPADGSWGEDNSMLIDGGDVDIDPAGGTHYVYIDGSAVPQGYCIQPDHYVTTVQVTIRSATPLGVETLRDLIQTRHEVIGLVQKEAVCIVRNAKHRA